MKKILIALVLLPAILGMTNRTSFQKLRSFATNQAYTPAQIQNATRDQIQNQLNLTIQEAKEYRHFWRGMKEILLRDAIERQTKARRSLFRQQIEAAYPNAVGLDTQTAKDIFTALEPLLYGEVDPNAL